MWWRTRSRSRRLVSMDVIFVDLDGTLARMGKRHPYDGRRAVEDTVNRPVADVVQTLATAWECPVFVLSGRSDQHRVWTQRWLDWWEVPHDRLLMRAWGDNRADDVVKEEMLDNLLAEFPDLNVRAVFDDRLRVVKMWHRRGLPLFRVGDPEASF